MKDMNPGLRKAHMIELFKEPMTLAKLNHPNIVDYKHVWIQICQPASKSSQSSGKSQGVEKLTQGLEESGEDIEESTNDCDESVSILP
jgi:hypothetical protein